MDPKRKQVWQYKINYRDDGDTLKGGKLEWVLYKGKLVAGGENRFKDCIAWKLTSNSDKVYYTLYFWTRATIFEQYRPYLDKIISSFKAIP